ncbi:MAG: AgmX/PglI C-terminal domain-containing protein [Anaeromyxobacter sp.]
MAPGNDADLDDPKLAGGEWLFRKGGEVYGPVDGRRVAELLYAGELDAGTPVSKDDGERWALVSEVPAFVVHAKKAQKKLEIEREITSARALAERRGRLRLAALGAVGLVAIAGAGVGAWVMTRPSAGSGLLEDFGEGIRIVSAAKVGVSRRAAAAGDEVEVALEPLPATGGPGQPRPARRDRPSQPADAGAPPRAPAGRPAGATGTAQGEDLVLEARFDASAIQAGVARQQRTLVPCFREQAARDPEYRGQVPLEFTIGNDGRIAALWIDEPRFRTGPLRDCVQKALGGWKFDPFPGQRPTVQLAFGVGG